MPSLFILLSLMASAFVTYACNDSTAPGTDDTPQVSARVVDTGQDRCYDNRSAITCPSSRRRRAGASCSWVASPGRTSPRSTTGCAR